jgi:arsenate reductase-like glutaredoxin family protein
MNEKIEKQIEKRRSQEPTVQQLKDMVAQLTQENAELKSANKQAAQALNKYKSLLAYTVEMCHDKEMAILHDHAMANAARRNPGIEP